MVATFHFSLERAGRARPLANAMANGQRHALRRFGLAHLVQPGDVDPAAYLIAAHRESGPVCAGLRLHPRRAAHPLPLELAVAIPAGVVLKLDQLEPRGLAELCALWVSADVEDKHLAVRMLRFAIRASAGLGWATLVALGGQHSLPLALRVGFRFDETEPTFVYPDERYRSRLVWLRMSRSAAEAGLKRISDTCHDWCR
jgi:hypothetical protein